MNFELKTLDLEGATAEKVDALVVLVTESFLPLSSQGVLAQLIGSALKGGDLTAKAGKLLHAYRSPGVTARNLVIVGAGTGSALHLQQAIRAAFGSLKIRGVKRVSVLLTDAHHSNMADVVIQAVADVTYIFTLTKPTAESYDIDSVVLGVTDAKAGRVAFDRGQAQALGIALAKEWANRPANYATPTLIADAAKALAKLSGVSCEILGPKEVAKLGMGSFIGVALGSDEPLRFIILKYQGVAKSEAPVVLIGKGITFDTGGISIKPASDMDEMKFDMCGAASVLGTFRAIAELKPEVNVVGLIPACENMPSGRALKPGDVVTSMSGQTIEVLNTDAEGRLVLCDALTYAQRFKPQAVIDVATLTGACVVALGGVRSGLFSTDDKLAQELASAGDAAYDLCWRMPLDSEYADGLKTNFADVANIAGRAAGAITAAKFLERFAKSFAWAHLDIAGTAWKSGGVKGATGRPVGLLLHFLLGRAETPMVDPKREKVATKRQRVRTSDAVKPALASGKSSAKDVAL